VDFGINYLENNLFLGVSHSKYLTPKKATFYFTLNPKTLAQNFAAPSFTVALQRRQTK
jgi:hypothetical protein